MSSGAFTEALSKVEAFKNQHGTEILLEKHRQEKIKVLMASNQLM